MSPPQACVVVLVHEDAGRRLGSRERLFHPQCTRVRLLHGTLDGTRNLLAGLMPGSVVVDMGRDVDRAIELRAQLEHDPRFSGVPIVVDLDLG